MEKENKPNVEVTEDTSQGTQPAEPEKKYTDADVNNISTKNSAKAVKKVLQELGVAEDADRAEIKAMLEQARQNGGTNEQVQVLQQQLAEAQAANDRMTLERILLAEKVKPDKVEKAAKLIDRADCLDEDGKFSKDKAAEAAKALLKDWQELVETPEAKNIGFSIGADGQQQAGGAPAEKKPAQKSWNKFNQ